MTTTSVAYGAVTTLTFTLASLASDTNLVAGRESNSLDNSSALAVDYQAFGLITLGTSPTTGKQLEIWCVGAPDGTSYPGGATGSDANLTPQEKTLFKLVTMIPTNSTTNQAYNWGPFGIAQLFGGAPPKKFSFYVVHNTGVALNATGGNFLMKVAALNFTNA